jgi:hypothetical protein
MGANSTHLSHQHCKHALVADGTSCDGTIEAVGSDYLEIAEHDLGEARRRGAVRARRFIGFAAVVAVTVPQERR